MPAENKNKKSLTNDIQLFTAHDDKKVFSLREIFQLVFKTLNSLCFLNVLWQAIPQFQCHKRESSTIIVFSSSFLMTE